MNSTGRLTVVVLAILCLSLPQVVARDPSQNLLQGDPLRGRQLFVSKGCLECHSIRGVGGRVGPDLGLKVFNKSVYEIAGILWNHSPFMSRKMRELEIPRPQFSASEMLDMISFLYFLNYFDPPGDSRVGRQVWVAKRCSVCHSVGEEGQEGPGPPIDRIQSPPTSVFLAQSMWNHGAAMLEMFRLMGVEPPQFGGTEMVDLAAYVRHLNRTPRGQLLALGNPSHGQRLFRIKGCASCHGGAAGHETGAPDLSGPQFQASVSQIAGTMWNHLPNMYVRMRERGVDFPTFSGQEMNDIISYLYSLAYIGTPGKASAGAVVYREKKCLDCHGRPDRNEARVGPDLAKVDSANPLGAIPAMWNHGTGMQEQMSRRSIVWPRFEGTEMADLQAYLQSMQQKKGP